MTLWIDNDTKLRVNINAPYKDFSRLDTPEIRERAGVVEIADPLPPEDIRAEFYANPDWYTVDETKDNAPPYILWTRKSQDQIDAIIAQKAKQQAKRDAISENAENATIKYLTSHTPAQIATYVQNNVTDLASAKVVIARLAIAVGSMLR